MFEKEAEEIEKEAIKWVKDVFPNDEFKQSGISRALVEFAEFGYNKANEWHFVKDGEYPTHSNRVLVFTDEGVGFGIYGLDNKKWYTYDTGFDVIAWKEITLPALPKEIKKNESHWSSYDRKTD